MSSKFSDAIRLNNSISLLNEVLFVEANPIPVKWALYKMKKIHNGIRSPLSQLSMKFESLVTEALDLAGITY